MSNPINLARRDVLRATVGVGIAAGFATPALAQSRAANFTWTKAAPSSVGMSPQLDAKIAAVFKKHMDAGHLTGGVTAVARRNRLVHYEAHGVRDIETGTAMRRDDIHRMMSSTKPTIGVAAMMMMEEGKLDPSDKVSRFIPEFKDTRVAVLPAGVNMAEARTPEQRRALANQCSMVAAARELTVADFMTHTSGLSSGGAGGLVNTVRRQPGDTLATYIPRLGSAALDFQPGSQWRYSASDGIDVLLRVVEVASRTPADVFLRERLWEPLDMRDTGFNIPREKYQRILTLYSREGQNWRPSRGAFGYSPTTYFSGAGGTMSTAHDYMHFEQMLLNKGAFNGRRILKPSSVELMATNHVGNLYGGTNGRTSGTGFGYTVRVLQDPKAADSGRSPGAFGWGGAYGTASWTDPKEDLTAALFIQQPGNDVLKDFEYAIREAIVA